MAILRPFQGLHFTSAMLRDPFLLNKLQLPFDLTRPRKVQELLSHIETMQNDHEGLVNESAPAFYVVEIRMGVLTSTAVVGMLDGSSAAIHRHENIHSYKNAHYLQSYSRHQMQLNPIMMAYNSKNHLKSLLHSITQEPPLLTADLPKAAFRLWKVHATERIQDIQHVLEATQAFFLLDGHHRFHIINNRPEYKKHGFFSALFCSEEVNVKSVFRGIEKLPVSWSQFLAHLEPYFVMEPDDSTEVVYDEFVFIMYTPSGQRMRLLPKQAQVSHLDYVNRVGSLYFHEAIAQQALGSFTRMDSEFLKPLYPTVSHESIVKLIGDKSFEVIFLVPKISFEQFVSIVSQNLLMPASSTWFEPKMLDGLIMVTTP